MNHFSADPFHSLHFMKGRSGHWKKNQLLNNHLLIFLVLLFSASRLTSGQRWDGVVVTQADFQALRALKHDFIDFKGILRSWNDSGLGACSGGWAGIKCVKGQVIAIQLPWKGLGGRISEKIGQLQALRRISLHDNVLGGAVPNSLSLLPNLRGVYLFNNRLSGSIPPSIGNCPLLQALDVSNNQLTGTIPPSLASSTRLYRLNLSFNSLSGSIPKSLSESPSLTFLALQHNNLSGSLPNSWGGNGIENKNRAYQLQILTLDHNLLSGSIPASLGKLVSLEVLTLSHNRIGGKIPEEIGSLPGLQVLDFSANTIEGSFPVSISNMSSLVSLNLEGNGLGGEIPEAIDGLKNLTVLDLKNNQFSGPVPATIGNMSSITGLDLSNNNFTGEIPNSVSDMPNLAFLNLSYNNLSGAVPSLLLKKFNSSSFVGNLQLCGYASNPCPAPPSPQILPSEKPRHHRKLSTKDIILIASGALLVVLLLLCCVLLCCLIRKKGAAKDKNGKRAAPATAGRAEKAAAAASAEAESGGEAGGKLVHFDGPFVFTADDLLCATAEIMGKSTYGTVYKATLEDGNQVAVKRLREKVAKGQKEFETEVNVLGKIRHPNILALRAYYLGPKGEKLLVFDYMANGSLASFLHARGPETTVTWPTRMKIAMGIARGLSYLHTQEKMVHGNLTSSNVVLDEETSPKISDVGLHRLMTSAANTNVVATAGTLGYRAPELSKLKNATTKTDVYSLGVIMLELLTGKAPGEAAEGGGDLPLWVASIVKEEWTNEVFDVELMRDSSNSGDELLNTLKLALHCVDPSPAARPEAQQVLQQLEQIKPELAAATAASGDEGAKAEAEPSPKDE
ncbi:Non-specific serine/threonine protein kinase [Bertholletia excelsa]